MMNQVDPLPPHQVVLFFSNIHYSLLYFLIGFNADGAG